jgi:hypothetical protein
VLASGAITPHDSLRVELHQPIGSPAFVLARWPEALSITSTEPKALASSVSRIGCLASGAKLVILLCAPLRLLGLDSNEQADGGCFGGVSRC